MAALALSGAGRPLWSLERLAARAVGVASLLAMLSVAVNYQALNAPAGPVAVTTEEVPVLAVDAVGIVLGLTE
jgi:hypothetical protein